MNRERRMKNNFTNSSPHRLGGEKPMTQLLRRGWQITVLLACGVLLGCGQSDSNIEKPPPPEVMVSYPVRRSVTDYDDFSGKTEALRTVDIRARVTGYLDKVCFEEGAEVKRGATLFVID